MESEIFIPAPFMRPLGGDQALGNIYEMRSYTYKTGAMPEVIQRWQAAVPHREEHSPSPPPGTPNSADSTNGSTSGPTKTSNTATASREAAAQSPHWPPPTREFLLSQENKIMVPATFSPTH